MSSLHAIEALGSILGLAGAFLLATKGRRAAYGWWAFLASNAAWLTFAWMGGFRWLLAMQVGFTITSCIGLWTWIFRPRLQWTEWRSDFDGKVTMQIMPLLRWRGRRIDLHRMVGVDSSECFHTHPARAIRIVLWGGYDEEIHAGGNSRLRRSCEPGLVGLVLPDLAHRISRLHGRVSYSLWLRGRKTDPIWLVGAGWGPHEGRAT